MMHIQSKINFIEVIELSVMSQYKMIKYVKGKQVVRGKGDYHLKQISQVGVLCLE
jgi:hypothetical protein